MPYKLHKDLTGTNLHNPNTTYINDQVSSKYFDIGTMRIQWGEEAVAGDTAHTVTLPVAFADANYIIAISIKAGGWTTGGAIATAMVFESKTTTTFDLNRDDEVTGTITIDWIAIGLKP